MRAKRSPALRERGQLDNTKITVQKLDEGVSQHEYTVESNTSLTLVLTAIDSKSVDATVTVRLVGSGASATIIGVVFASKKSSIKINTLQQHEAPGTTSNLLVKTVLRDEAVCLIEGGIRVEKDAQKTDAYQRNENLLLSDAAHAESKPSLEILANDVRCTHGATVGPISEEQLWYLASRGIAKDPAEALIVEGFLGSALQLIPKDSVRYDTLQSIQQAL